MSECLTPSRVTLSLIIPAYNEADGLAQAIAEAEAALTELQFTYEILVVDDGSSDATARVAAEASARRPCVHLLRHEQNRGYGAALRTGFAAAQGALVAFTDADCQFDLTDLGRLVPLTERAAVVVGYRQQRQDPWQRCFFSRGYNLLARTLLGTGVRDVDCALKVFRREDLQHILPDSQGFFVNTEMLTRARQQGLTVAEVGVRHRPRLRGCSKVSLLDIPRTLRALLPFWWSRVVFAGPGAAAGPAPALTGILTQSLILLMLAVLLFFTRLNAPLLEPDEARYAEVARQMLSQGHLLVPILHGTPYYHKPPLLFWSLMGSYQVFGVHDWAARLIPGTAGVLLILLLYGWGRRVLGQQTAFLAGLILCLMTRFVYLGRMLTMDIVLTLCVFAALLAAYRALATGTMQRRWWLLSALLCGLGMLAKGPAALVLVGVPVLLFQLLDTRAARFSWRLWGSYLTATGLAGGSWYALLAWRDWEGVTTFLWRHNVVRYVAPFDHAEPFWYYLPDLLVGLLPWSLLYLPLLLFLTRRAHTVAERRSPALGFFLLAFLWCVLFFSGSGCKCPAYILPALPALAVVLSCYLTHGIAWQSVCWRDWFTLPLPAAHGWLAQRITVAVLLIGVGIGLLAAHVGLWHPWQGLAVAWLLLLPAALVFRFGARLSAPASWGLCVLTLFALQWGAIYELLPAYYRQHALRQQVHPHANMCAAENLPVFCYPRHWHSIGFYLRHDDVRAYSEQQLARMMADLSQAEQSLVFIKADRSLERFRRALPATLEFVPQPETQGRLVVGLVRPRFSVSDGRLAGRHGKGGPHGGS